MGRNLQCTMLISVVITLVITVDGSSTVAPSTSQATTPTVQITTTSLSAEQSSTYSTYIQQSTVTTSQPQTTVTLPQSTTVTSSTTTIEQSSTSPRSTADAQQSAVTATTTTTSSLSQTAPQSTTTTIISSADVTSSSSSSSGQTVRGATFGVSSTNDGSPSGSNSVQQTITSPASITHALQTVASESTSRPPSTLQSSPETERTTPAQLVTSGDGNSSNDVVSSQRTVTDMVTASTSNVPSSSTLLTSNAASVAPGNTMTTTKASAPNSTSNMSISTNGISTTTTVTTTISTQTTTKSSPVSPTKPVNWDKIIYNFNSSLKFDNITMGELTNNTELRTLFERAVEAKVNSAFTGCQGFGGKSHVNDLRNGSVICFYTVPFDGSIYNNKNKILEYINTTVMQLLKESPLLVNGSTYSTNQDYLTNEMSKDVNRYAASQLPHPCLTNPTDVCDPCYKCDETADPSRACQTTCLSADHKYCLIKDNSVSPWVFVCSCLPSYLPVSGDCVHEDVIIGASVGVVGAVLLALVIIVIVLACKLYRRKGKKSKNNAYHSIGRTEERYGAHGSYSCTADIRLQNVTPRTTATSQTYAAVQPKGVETHPDSKSSSNSESPNIAYDNPTFGDVVSTDFTASLRSVDTTKDYSITRPQLVQSTSSSMVRSS